MADHDVLNHRIREVFRRRPPTQAMRKADGKYFIQHSSDQLEKLPYGRKQRWVKGAEALLQEYSMSESEQSVRFRSYFQWDRG